MKRFNDLPLDLQTTILNYSRYGKSISKTSKEYNTKIFYDQYCHLPIGKRELINYIEQYLPQYFFIVSMNEFAFILSIFTHMGPKGYKIETHRYTNYRSSINYYSRFSTLSIEGIKTEIDFIYNQSKEYHNTILEIDLELTMTIISQRQCKDLQVDYVKQYIIDQFENTLDYLDDLKPFDNKKELFIIVSRNLYLLVNYHILSNGLINDIEEYVNDTIDADDYDRLIEEYYGEYQSLYDDTRDLLDKKNNLFSLTYKI